MFPVAPGLAADQSNAGDVPSENSPFTKKNNLFLISGPENLNPLVLFEKFGSMAPHEMF